DPGPGLSLPLPVGLIRTLPGISRLVVEERPDAALPMVVDAVDPSGEADRLAVHVEGHPFRRGRALHVHRPPAVRDPVGVPGGEGVQAGAELPDLEAYRGHRVFAEAGLRDRGENGVELPADGYRVGQVHRLRAREPLQDLVREAAEAQAVQLAGGGVERLEAGDALQSKAV